MKWFKHYNTASEGQSFENLISEKDFETAFIYWWILEQISKFEETGYEENRGKVTLNFSYFKRKLGHNRQRSVRVLSKIAKTFNLEVTVNSDETVSICVPNWLELQENRGGKRDAKENEKNSKKTQESRDKNQDLRIKIQSSDLELQTEIHELGKLWNLYAPKEIPKIKTTEGSRLKNIQKVFSKITSENWITAIKRLDNSDFLKGIGEKSWLANFDWFIKNYTKVLEGNYDNRRQAKGNFENLRDGQTVADDFNSLINEVRGES